MQHLKQFDKALEKFALQSIASFPDHAGRSLKKIIDDYKEDYYRLFHSENFKLIDGFAADKIPDFLKAFFTHLGSRSQEEIVDDDLSLQIAVWIYYYLPDLNKKQIAIPAQLRQLFFDYRRNVLPQISSGIILKMFDEAEGLLVVSKYIKRCKSLSPSEAEAIVDKLLISIPPIFVRNLNKLYDSLRALRWALEALTIPPNKMDKVIKTLSTFVDAFSDDPGHMALALGLPNPSGLSEEVQYKNCQAVLINTLKNLKIISDAGLDLEYLTSMLGAENRNVGEEEILAQLITIWEKSADLDPKKIEELMVEFAKPELNPIAFLRQGLVFLRNKNQLTTAQYEQIFNCVLEAAANGDQFTKRFACELLCKMPAPVSKVTAVVDRLCELFIDESEKEVLADDIQLAVKYIPVLQKHMTIPPEAKLTAESLLEKLNPRFCGGVAAAAFFAKINLSPEETTQVLTRLFKMLEGNPLPENIQIIRTSIRAICDKHPVPETMLKFLLAHMASYFGLACKALGSIAAPSEATSKAIYRDISDILASYDRFHADLEPEICHGLECLSLASAENEGLKELLRKKISDYATRGHLSPAMADGLGLTIQVYQNRYGLIPVTVLDALSQQLDENNILQLGKVLSHISIPASHLRKTLAGFVEVAAKYRSMPFTSYENSERVLDFLNQMLAKLPSEEGRCSAMLFLQQCIKLNIARKKTLWSWTSMDSGLNLLVDAAISEAAAVKSPAPQKKEGKESRPSTSQNSAAIAPHAAWSAAPAAAPYPRRENKARTVAAVPETELVEIGGGPPSSLPSPAYLGSPPGTK